MRRAKSKTPSDDMKMRRTSSGQRFDWIPPHPALGAQLLAALEDNPMDERDIAGVRLSRAIYMHFTGQEIRDLKEIFDFFDHKHRGNLKPKEIIYAMRTLGLNLTMEQCVAYIEKESRDLMTLDFGEFLLLLAGQQTEEQDDYDELNLAFQLFDSKGRDYLDLNDLRQISEQTNLNLSEFELQSMFEAADRNGDARIDRNEFVQIIRQTNLFSK